MPLAVSDAVPQGVPCGVATSQRAGCVGIVAYAFGASSFSLSLNDLATVEYVFSVSFALVGAVSPAVPFPVPFAVPFAVPSDVPSPVTRMMVMPFSTFSVILSFCAIKLRKERTPLTVHCHRFARVRSDTDQQSFCQTTVFPPKRNQGDRFFDSIHNKWPTRNQKPVPLIHPLIHDVDLCLNHTEYAGLKPFFRDEDGAWEGDVSFFHILRMRDIFFSHWQNYGKTIPLS